MGRYFRKFLLLNCLILNNCLFLAQIGSSRGEDLTRKPEHLKYLLYTFNRPKFPSVFKTSSPFTFEQLDAKVPLKVIIHGYILPVFSSVSGTLLDVLDIKEAYFRSGLNVNVLMCDWSSYSSFDYVYDQALTHTIKIGEEISDILIRLKSHGSIQSFTNVHIIGSGLGAQAAGIIGRILKEKEKESIGRITGLDPDYPENLKTKTLDNENSLDPTDASFVDIIHCNINNPKTFGVPSGKYGSKDIRGTADFYPNGGEKQPSCKIFDDLLDLCSHTTACTQIYVNSISKDYVSCKADSWKTYLSNLEQKKVCNKADEAIIGEHCPATASGQYYVRTSNS